MNRPFARRSNAPRLSPEEAARQGKASWLAFEALGSKDAITFLNGHDESLGGRPIDLAIKSDEGFAAVESALTKLRKV